MKHLFNPHMFKNIVSLLILLLILKGFWFVVGIVWLPSSGEEHAEQKGAKPLYYRVKLTPNEAPAPIIKKSQPHSAKLTGSIKDIKLLAIYNASDVTVITIDYKTKTKVLARGDTINGFVLEGAGSNFATFSKHSKIYKVRLSEGKKDAKSTTYNSSFPTSSRMKKTKKQKIEGDVTDAGDHKVIDKSLLDYYAKNMDDIYKNIGINEVRNGKDLEGFRITFVRKGTPFAKLGVRRGDIIKSINGQEINSHKAAFDVYKNIQNVENLTLGIQRGKMEMELEYEIN